MDQVSCIAYLLHKSQEENIKEIAIELLTGDLTLKEAKQISPFVNQQIKQAEILYKRKDIDLKNVTSFVQDFMFVT